MLRARLAFPRPLATEIKQVHKETSCTLRERKKELRGGGGKTRSRRLDRGDWSLAKCHSRRMGGCVCVGSVGTAQVAPAVRSEAGLECLLSEQSEPGVGGRGGAACDGTEAGKAAPRAGWGLGKRGLGWGRAGRRGRVYGGGGRWGPGS